MEWLNGFIIPLIKVTFLLGIAGFIGFYFYKAFDNAWSKSFKFFFKHKIMRKPYDKDKLEWVLTCIDKGIGYYDAKKMLFLAMIDQKTINETMWIYDQVINELNAQNKVKGGVNNGREFKGSDRKTKSTAKLPNI